MEAAPPEPLKSATISGMAVIFTREAATALVRELEADFVLLTRGRDGMAVAESDGAFHEIPISGTAEAADVTGAGDTVAAAALLAIAAGGSPREAAELATVAAGLVVQKHGAATTTPEEIERVWMLRKVLNELDPVEAMEMLIQKMKKTRVNGEFLLTIGG